MMQERKRQKAAQLFLAMGQIDDALLQDAMLYRPRRKPSALSRVMLLAATLSACAVVLVAGVIVAMRATDDGLPQLPTVNEPTINVPNESLDEDQAAFALDRLLTDRIYNSAGATSFSTVTSADELPFFSGNAHVIWEQDGVYYVSRALTKREITALTGELGKGERVGEESPALSCRVWILLPDGTVLSPYLEPSSGNTANGTLFDYQAELIPSDAFLSYISGILN